MLTIIWAAEFMIATLAYTLIVCVIPKMLYPKYSAI